jgi:DUF4097 and DUF4098 domain-containing protein YvlB
MSPTSLPRLIAVALAIVLLPQSLSAQDVDQEEWCRDRDSDRERHCEVRELTLQPTGGTLEIDAAPNGGITVEGWDRNDIKVFARIVGRADRLDDAQRMVREVDVDVDGLSLSADGPRTDRNESWSVSFKVFAPRQTDLDLETTNGGVSLSDMSGDLEFRTTNGGVRLTGLAGNVKGRTVNGGVKITLGGDRWQGEGLDVKTTNGSVALTIPEDYSATVETGTVNGSMTTDFPVTIQGRFSRRELEFTVGDGGQPIRVRTTNGSVRLNKTSS